MTSISYERERIKGESSMAGIIMLCHAFLSVGFHEMYVLVFYAQLAFLSHTWNTFQVPINRTADEEFLDSIFEFSPIE